MSHKRVHIVIPEELAAEIDQMTGKRGRSQFLVDAAHREISRHRMVRAVSQAAGAWKDEDHPDIRRGADRYVARIRRESEKRLRTRRPAKP